MAPASIFPQLSRYMNRKIERAFKPLMDEARPKIVASMKAAVEAGQKKHKEWIWTQ